MYWAFTSPQVWELWIGSSGVDLITIWLVPCTDASCIRTKPTLFSPFPLFPPTSHRLFAFKFLFIVSFSLFWLISFVDHMSPIRKPLPSFTLVITSGHHSLLPTTVQFDSYASPTMLPTGPDYLMVHNTYYQAYFIFWLTFAWFHLRKPSIYATIRGVHWGMLVMRMPTYRPFLKQKVLPPLVVGQSKLVTTPSKYVHPQQRLGFHIQISISRTSCSSFANFFLTNGTSSTTDHLSYFNLPSTKHVLRGRGNLYHPKNLSTTREKHKFYVYSHRFYSSQPAWPVLSTTMP